jgi:hypothetical protein
MAGNVALLADRQSYSCPPVSELKAVPAPFVNREVARDVRAYAGEPRKPDRLGAVLLVGLGDEDEIAPWLEA